MKYFIIINPKSGNKNSSKKLVKKIKEHLEDSYKIYYTKYAGHGAKLAKEADKNNVEVVVACGGDGTINEIASSLVNTNTALGVIPTGSGNGFARSLNIPLKMEEAITLLNKSEKKPIDVGKINNRYFFGIAGIGFDALIGSKFQQFGKRGPLPYFFISVGEYFKYEYEAFKIEENGAVETVKPLLIAVANTSQYGNGAKIAPQADPADGWLDLCIINRMKKIEVIRNIKNLFNGKMNLQTFYSHRHIKSIVIKRENTAGFYHVDGEPFYDKNDLNITIIPNALNVCVPIKS